MARNIGGKNMRKVIKGNYADQANAKRGMEINDTVILETRKGESTETTLGVNTNGVSNKTIVVL